MEQELISSVRYLGSIPMFIVALMLALKNRGRLQSTVYNRSRCLLIVAPQKKKENAPDFSHSRWFRVLENGRKLQKTAKRRKRNPGASQTAIIVNIQPCFLFYV